MWSRPCRPSLCISTARAARKLIGHVVCRGSRGSSTGRGESRTGSWQMPRRPWRHRQKRQEEWTRRICGWHSCSLTPAGQRPGVTVAGGQACNAWLLADGQGLPMNHEGGEPHLHHQLLVQVLVALIFVILALHVRNALQELLHVAVTVLPAQAAGQARHGCCGSQPTA